MTEVQVSKLRLVRIDWVDSHSSRGWQQIEDIGEARGGLHCSSVGWLLAEGKETVTIAAHLGLSNDRRTVTQGHSDMTIPRVAITKMRFLVRPKPS